MSDWSHEWGDTPCGRCAGTRGLHAQNCPTQKTAKSPSGNPQAQTYKTAEPAKTKFRKRPVVVGAVQYELGKGLEDAWGYRTRDGLLGMCWDGLARPVLPDPKIHGPLVPVILNKGIGVEIAPGDWIVTDITGDRSVCKPDIFAATYEPVEG